MAAIIFDKIGERYYETGTDRGVLYPTVAETSEYGVGVAWNGLISVSERPGGAEANDLYADNIKYASLRSAETFDATVEAYTYPEEFNECDGSKMVAPGVYIGQQARRPFALTYRTLVGSDTTAAEDNYKLHLVYNCTVSPSQKDYQTVNDSPEAITFSWEMESTPVPVTGQKPTSTLIVDSRKVSAEKLAALEAILYGTEEAEPRMPMPDEVIALLADAA